MLTYLNAGFGETLGAEWLDKIHSLGFTGIRTDISINWRNVVDELGEYNKLSPIFLFGGGTISGWTEEDFRSYVTLVAKHILEMGYFTEIPIFFEIGNEPDISDPYWKESPSRLNSTLWNCYQIARSIDSGIDVITGGISNLTSAGLNWLEDFVELGLPANAIIGFHRYSNGTDVGAPQKGFESRQHEMNRLVSLAGSRRLFCTETGVSQGPHRISRGFPLCWLNKHVWLTEEETGTAFRHEHAFYAVRPQVLGMVWYQLRDGSDPRNIMDHYGLYNLDESEKWVLCESVRGTLQPV